MHALIEWVISSKVLYVTLSGSVSLVELDRLNRQLHHHLQVGALQTHIMLDTRQLGHYPQNAAMLSRALSSLDAPNVGSIALIAYSPSVRYLHDVLASVMGLNVICTQSKDEALAALHTVDLTLDSLAQTG